MTGSPAVIASTDALAGLVEGDLGTGDWMAIDQHLIDAFADTTRDRQWLHTDPARAAAGPYGSTVAHGYLVLSLLPWLTASAYRIDGVAARINYGLERVRFPGVVRAGARIRNRAHLVSLERGDAGIRIVVRNTVEVEGSERPACVAETVTVLVPEV